MITSTSESSNPSFITIFFDEDMKQDLFIMMDIVREMSVGLWDQWNSMKEEQQLLSNILQEVERQLHITNMNLERVHELELQLFVTKEASVKYQLEEEVNKLQFVFEFL